MDHTTCIEKAAAQFNIKTSAFLKEFSLGGGAKQEKKQNKNMGVEVWRTCESEVKRDFVKL